MNKPAWRRLLALLFAFSLVAAACGGGDDEGTEAGADEGGSDTTEAMEEETEDDGETGGQVDEDEAADAMADAADAEEVEAAADSFEGLQEVWAAERASIVAALQAGEYGVGDDGVLVGPGGFTLDTNACPADWDNNEGITADSILIGHTTAQSGALAAYGNIGVGMEAYFNYVNANGGINGANIDITIKDDAYVATQTQELVNELLQSDKPFAINTLGSPNTFAVYNQLNDECVPQPMVMTGHQAWGDPESHPWTTGYQLSYATESLLWGSWIEQNFPDGGVTVGALVMDNDFGLAYELGFADFVENSDIIDEVEFVRHDPAAATLTNEVTTIAAGDPDIFISMTAGNPCLLAIQEAARAGLLDSTDALFTPSVCKAVSAYMEPAGDAADGWYIVGGGLKDTTDPQWADDPWVSFVNTEVEAAGLDSGISLFGDGFHRGWAFEQALLIAAELDGGVTRTNFIIALRGMTSMTNPGFLDGIQFGMNGNEDAYLIEGSDISLFDAGAQTWVKEGGVIDLAGTSPNCNWVAGEGC